ncbi:MAG: alkaline phosphatase family protein [Planctomycetota bacterium]
MSKRIVLALGMAALAVIYLPSAGAKEEEGPPRNVILIGWDGAQRNHLKECLGRGELPNLKKLASEGSLVAIDILRITDTKAGWSQILSGYNPEVTGVFRNGQYQPIPKGYTVFERLENHFGADNIVTLAVIGKKGHVDADAPKKVKVKETGKRKKARQAKGKIVEENGVKYRVTPGKPYYRTKDGMDLFENGLTLDEKVGARALELIDKHKDQRFFFFVHFAEVDQKGHRHGENSKEYNDALVSADTWTGRIMEKLKALGLYDKTLIYVTADHGFDEGKKSHRDAPYVFLATNDPKVMRRGERADIGPTILERFGLDLSKIEPPLDGRPLTRSCEKPLW